MENERNVQPRLESNVVVSTERELPPRRDESEIPTRILEPIVFKTQYVSLLSISDKVPNIIKMQLSRGKKTIKDRIRQITIMKEANVGTVDTFIYWKNIEQQVRFSMRRLVYLWLQRKYGKRFLNEDDPCTLSIPVKSIQFFDINSRGNYQFEASSLKKQFENCLTYSTWMFPEPKHPKNPLTNLDFNEGQRISIIEKLRAHGLNTLFIEAYKMSKWNLVYFRIDNYTQLKISAINHTCNNLNSETTELLTEFIEQQFYENDISDSGILTTLKWAVKNKIGDEYMKKWIHLMRDYYIIKTRYSIGDSDTEHVRLNVIYIRSSHLFQDPCAEEYRRIILTDCINMLEETEQAQFAFNFIITETLNDEALHSLIVAHPWPHLPPLSISEDESQSEPQQRESESESQNQNQPPQEDI